ncbi:MAG: hypothetical protein KME49_00685 [Brasilonema octagenarum HA4186-MV1]|jgi:hypothetical protein|uniref:Uncharacterized protein n=1 Tax=Brasilonema sennae CENA114 TaxID=415709 RepID=A0A856MGT1_9CYAN|nr:hypothetical protein [Brasilonema sennae]MBW4624052.1 hypothetical protein [Brasilonema octagenarum HA4186-MV1]QDL08881.1 hypothetical protein DP114_14120 [Brasilonema sennae CENA114]QDL15238.1 hypothetical protein DP113_14060 [Brasilonema octagenarum UFV-E1]
MVLIRDVVQEAIAAGYLSLAAEEQLRNLLKKKYELEDFNAFMTLQEVASLGKIRQESRELRLYEQQMQ